MLQLMMSSGNLKKISPAGSVDKMHEQDKMSMGKHNLPPVAPSRFGKVEPASVE